MEKPANFLRGIRFQLQERWKMRSDAQAGDELRLIASK
jgi:hypothetical protein